MKNLFLLLLLFFAMLISNGLSAANETEPNDSYAQANLIHADTIMNGNVCSNEPDYFKTLLPEDGTVRVIISRTNTSGSAFSDFYLRGYQGSKNSDLISGFSYDFPVNATRIDTYFVHCQAMDTFTFYISSTGCFSYELSYSMVAPGVMDNEPNNDRATALPLAAGSTVRGHIGYTGENFTDPFDFYKTVLPEDGTIEVIISRTNTTNNAFSDFYLRGYQGSKNSDRISGFSYDFSINETRTDTYYVHCQAADTFFFSVASTGCFSYELSYNMVAPGVRDNEPNNDRATALPLAAGSTVRGHIGYTGENFTDPFDFYKTVLPEDGTIEVIISRTNTTNSAFSDFYLRGYQGSKNSDLISGFSYDFPINETRTDTYYVFCQAADTFFFSVASTGCFSYELSYNMVAPGVRDNEPNNNRATALPLNAGDTVRGHIGYTGENFTDPFDFYKTVLPEDGTIEVVISRTNTTNNAFPDFYLRGYQGSKNSDLISGFSYDFPVNETRTDTYYVFCQAADTFFFSIASTGCFTYALTYKMVAPGVRDNEPNNDRATALPLAAGDTVLGHIGYTGENFTDPFDFYKTVLPENGTIEVVISRTNTSNSAFSDFYLRGYQGSKNSDLISGFSYDFPINETRTDTYYVFCQAADTFFFSIASTGCFSYALTYNIISTGSSDADGNDDFNSASIISIADTTSGHVGYTGGHTGNDNNDYFKFATGGRGSLDLELKIKSTNNSSGSDFYVYVYTDGRKSAGQKFYYNLKVDTLVVDTLYFSCLTTDSVWIRVFSNGCFAYEFVNKWKSEVVQADIEMARLGNEVGFRANTINAQTFLWDFDDGTTSSLRFPLHRFDIGSFEVKLIAINPACNFRDTATELVIVKGVEKYDPQLSGEGGDCAMHIYGGGLDTTTEVVLKKGTVEIRPVARYGNNKQNLLTAVLDLHQADRGVYDVIITIPGEAPIVYPNGFTIDSFIYPAATADITGPSLFRINRDTRFYLNVTNTGNVTANGAIVVLAWPKNVELTFEHQKIRPPTSGTLTISTEDTTVSMDWSEQSYIYDSVITITPIDSFEGEPYDGYVRFLMIPHIPAGATYSLPFIAKATSSSVNSFITYTLENNMFGSPNNPNYLDMTENFAVQSIDLVDMAAGETKVPLIIGAAKALKIGHKHLAVSGKLAGAKFDSWWNGYEMSGETYQDIWQDLDAANDYAMKTTYDEVANFALEKGVGKMGEMYTDQIHAYNKVLTSPINKNMSPQLRQQWINNLLELHENAERLDETHKMFKEAKNLQALNDKIQELEKIAADCPIQKKQLEELKKKINKPIKPKDKKKKNSRSVTSMDPNAIYGPTGVGVDGWIKNNELMHYMITFENVDTAQADAQIVIVTDTLDPAIFDLSTFQFGNFGFGKHSRRMPASRQEFVFDVDMSPDKNMIVRVIAKLDTVTGIITWTFISIDPQTGELPVLEGFLPPNKTSPEGEGSVMYSVSLRDDVPNKLKISKTANIFFDDNAPIQTNTWENNVDIGLPTSSITATATDTAILLTFNSNDSESGVQTNYAYLKDASGTWVPYIHTPYDTITVYGKPGETYEFYGSAEDNLGQEELKMAGTEATVTIEGIEVDKSVDYTFAPNPTSGELFITANTISGKSDIIIQNILGKIVETRKADFRIGIPVTMDLSHLPSNLFIITIVNENGHKFNGKVIKI